MRLEVNVSEADSGTLKAIGEALKRFTLSPSADGVSADRLAEAVLAAAARSWRHSGGKAVSLGISDIAAAAGISIEDGFTSVSTH